MINISACDYDQFEKYMVGQFGPEQFKTGFEIIKSNRDMQYEEGGDEKMKKMLQTCQFKDNE